MPDRSEPPLVVVMGVSGSGKSRIGTALAQRLGIDFLEGDNLHTPSAIAKMSSGVPLSDDDREPWLKAIGTWLAESGSASGGVVSCSALRRAYRETLVAYAPRVVFLQLEGSTELLRDRMRERDHFMPETLLVSQLDTLEPLEPDEPGVILDASRSPDQVVAAFVRQL